MLRRVLAPTVAAATNAAVLNAALVRQNRGAHAQALSSPEATHPGMGDKDAWRGHLTGKPLTDVFTNETLTWSSSLCFGAKDGSPPAVVDATTKERLQDITALLGRRTAAGFGRSDAPKATFQDDAVRRTSVVPGVEIEWPGLEAAVEKVRATLYPGEGPLTATLHNVLVYEAGDHFDWHRDMPKVPGHLATLSVECDVTGTSPTTGPDAAAVVFAEEGGSTADCRVYAPREAGDWAAWPIATRHRAVPVPAGASRVTAIFNVARTVGEGETPLAEAVATVPATHRPAMAAVGDWMAQQRPELWDSWEYDFEDEYYDAYDHRGPPTNAHNDDSFTAIGILLEDVIGTTVTNAAESLTDAEKAQAEEEGWSNAKQWTFLNKKKFKAATASLEGKWRDLTSRDRLLYFAAVARFGEENVYLHQAQETPDEPVCSALKPSDDAYLAMRPFDHVRMITFDSVGPAKLKRPITHGVIGNSGPEGKIVYDRTVLCVTLRRPSSNEAPEMSSASSTDSVSAAESSVEEP